MQIHGEGVLHAPVAGFVRLVISGRAVPLGLLSILTTLVCKLLGSLAVTRSIRLRGC
jgi:hypothetical protein